MMNWKKTISSKFPWIPSAKRNWVACRDNLLSGKGGSQCGEDKWILERCKQLRIDYTSHRYIEVGANQPTQSSNSWRLYRDGCKGLLVEPDPRCVTLLRRWRSRDVIVPALAGEHSTCEILSIHQHTTMNEIGGIGKQFIGQMLLPVVRVDDLIKTLSQNDDSWKRILLLSVDTEGFDEYVLRGSVDTISKTQFVCVENWKDQEVVKRINDLIGSDFRPVHQTALNIVFERTPVICQ
ncbi:MAG: FkbM family methyltransferase [Planctomycetota bacterium]